MELVTIFKTFNPAEAQVQRSRLEAAGFDASIKNELSSIMIDGYTMAAGGIQVQVPEDQAADARALLEPVDDSANED
ncbi:MAG TPA: hypothetical protein DCY13_08535 [Verrucomicrobiales bacterium]|nr:hypothetical protein [Verrucomicrobiales bacterium]